MTQVQNMDGVDADEFFKIVERDVDGTATAAESEALRADPETVREWRAVLTRMAQNTEAAFGRIKAEVLQAQQDSLAEGPSSKGAYFALKAKREREKVALLRQKAAIVERLKEAKDMVTAHSIANEDARKSITWQRLDAIEQKLDRVLALLTSEDA